MKKYFIGWHQPVNGPSGCGSFEYSMISVNRLVGRKSDFKVNKWMLDSGAFTRIFAGKWHLSTRKYAALIKRWSKCGKLLAAVSQDYMCESIILNKTGLTIADHQRLTILRYDNLLNLLGECDAYLMPVLQGYTPEEYISHIRQYGDRLKPGAWVGVGSVCKRNGSPAQIERVLLAIKGERPDLKLHGFGLKRTSLQSNVVWDLLYSADSQAHSYNERAKKTGKSNCPVRAAEYASQIKKPIQASIFSLMF